MKLFILLSGCNPSGGQDWSGSQANFAADAPRLYCDQLSTCPNAPGDFSKQSCRSEFAAYIKAMPCFSETLATSCMEQLGEADGGAGTCTSFWQFPEDASCQWAAWEAEPCSYR
jgi:hypothetical protein